MDKGNKKNAIFLSVSSFSLAGMLFFAILPSVSNIKTIAAEINAEIEGLKIRSSEGQSIDKNISKLNEIKKSEEIKNSFIIKDEEIGFIKELESVAKNLNLVQSIDIAQAMKTDNKKDQVPEKEMPVTIKLKGDYPSLIQYLVFLERGSYYININSISFGRVGGTTTRSSIIINPDSISEELDIMSTQLNLTIKANVFRREI
jgi:hypothetical protein